jgi:hypothetical protein
MAPLRAMSAAPSDPRQQAHPKTVVFDGTINLGHVLTLLAMLVTVGAAWFNLDKRIVVLERDSMHQAVRDNAQDGVMRDGLAELKVLLRDMQGEIRQLRSDQAKESRR